MVRIGLKRTGMALRLLFERPVRPSEFRYDTIREFNVDWNNECGQLNLAHVKQNKKYKKEKNKTNASAH